MKLTCSLTLFAVMFFLCGGVGAQSISIIPKPNKVTVEEGNFSLNSKTVIIYSPSSTNENLLGEYLVERLNKATGFSLASLDSNAPPKTNYILFSFSNNETLSMEGYHLEVHKGNIILQAKGGAGFLYGVQTLLQLFPKEIFNENVQKKAEWNAPCVTIDDAPRFA